MASFSPYAGLHITHGHRVISARFNVPHRVLSTCRAHGGQREDLTCVFNHQCCEPAGHSQSIPVSAYQNPEAYTQLICELYGLPPETSAVLSTAANMHCASIQTETFDTLIVTAIVTGGVESNAGRAGDAASYLETEAGSAPLQATDAADPNKQGTINTLLFINRELTPGAMARTIMMATEAKTSVLQELSVPSRYSEGLATGTGTDQIAVACKRDTGKPLTSAGKHSKLGELIARAVRRATRETLTRQNGLTPCYCCSVVHLLRRFGVDQDGLATRVRQWLSPELAEVFAANILCLNGDPPTVAAVAALLHIHDQCTWGVIPTLCRDDLLLTYSALISCAVSGRRDKLEPFRCRLEQTELRTAADLVIAALAFGFTDKWRTDIKNTQEEPCS